jgi:hypothetical protein
MHNPERSLWWRDSNKSASGKTGAVQYKQAELLNGS